MNNEIWKPIVGYEGLYEVSNLGRVKSLPRLKSSGIGKRNYITEEKILVKVNCLGYDCVNLYKDKKGKMFKVHRLVCENFLEKVDGKELVNHKDGNKKNNNLYNLEWCTSKENALHAFEIGLSKRKYQYFESEISDLYKYGFTLRDISKFYGCKEGTVLNILKRNNVETRKRNKYNINREEMKYMLDMNYENFEIADYFNCPRELVRNYKCGIKKERRNSN